ncbi:sulfate permease [Oxalobacteraceae bacterium R-40]|uniref:Sulfate permease n=1 Tax=Keguizhuia sedimenti TaxID=3064264 RepID=A0ABU1BKZ8_9BURK|nr:sulfate permease [Oxalobacteraceae bacterium R-40]
MKRLTAWLPELPILTWGKRYNKDLLTGDAIAAVIVTIMLIPQSLAYAMLAGLPPQAGIYASILPLVAYALFGSSNVLAVGPVAVASLMTASAIGQFAAAGSPDYWQAAIVLAFLSGGILLLLGLLRLGFFANFLSHPVISGFISASGLIIAASQVKHILGVKAEGENFFSLLASLATQAGHSHAATLAIGIGAIAFLFWTRKGLKPLLITWGVPARTADIIAKIGPVAAIAVTSLLVWSLGLDKAGVKVVGAVPQGLPPLTVPQWNPELWQALLVPAALISVVGFVESVSVGQTLAAKRRERIEPDQELVALGASNVAAAMTGGFPVTGGFARSVVNFDAGAQTPAAGVFTAVGLTLASLLLTPALYYLPQATLAATIIVAVLSLVDFSILKRTWAYSRLDFASVIGTLGATLLFGVEAGLLIGVSMSLAFFLYRTSKPHVAVVGWVPGTEHFRNIERHRVVTSPSVLGLRVDENLYFANARFLEDCINNAIATRPELKHVVLLCSAVNSIDASALESLENIEHQLRTAGISLHLSEVKGPVMDRLKGTAFLQHLSGKVYLTHFQAIGELAPELIKSEAEQKCATSGNACVRG